MNAPETARALPDPATLRVLSGRIALLEFLVAPDNRYPKYGFLPEWRPGWDLATMDNGGGDAYALALSDTAGVVRCFDHESETSPYANDGEFWPGTVDGLPEEFAPLLHDEDFNGGDPLAVSALLWRLPGDTAWSTGTSGDRRDGSGWLLGGLLDREPVRYHHDHFQDYYGRSLEQDAVRAVLEGRPLTETVVAGLHPTADPVETLSRARSHRS